MSYTLYTHATPNPIKVHIALEELGLVYHSVVADLGRDYEKSDEFLALNPNGRVPVLIDHSAGDFVVIESGAILLYLAEKHGKLLPSDKKQRSEAIQWLMWQMGGLGPMFGQLLVFAAAFENRMPEATARYQAEVERLLSVLNSRLEGREYLAGTYSVADIAVLGWVPLTARVGIALDGWPNVVAWLARCTARPAYAKALAAAGDPPEEERLAMFRRASVGVGS